MKNLLYFACVLLFSCATGKMHVQSKCTVKQVSGGYSKISDSDFVFEIKKLGRTYLNFIIDSCQRINTSEVHLIGYITFADGLVNGNGITMPDTDILQAGQTGKRMLTYFQYLGKTDQAGKFDIKVNIQQKDIYILLDKQNFTYTAVLLSF